MQISKQRLIQIIKEELNTQEPTNEAEDGELEVNEEKEMSRHAYELYKNIKKGYSPQAANTAIPGHEESYKAYWDSLNKKPKRMKKEALNTEEKQGQITYIIKMEEIISPYLHKEITDQVNKVSRDGDWSAGLNSMSDEQVHDIYSDVSEDFWSNHAPKEKYYEGKIAKSQLASRESLEEMIKKELMEMIKK
jgi:hypothetical protein|tara:strand:- start:6259 stop:6834 length:576 start_codon:yes stop_codon:yes gene_type:complete